MKIIALLPMKNEAAILPMYLASMWQIADEIIALDDGSTDSSAQIVRDSDGIVITHTKKLESGWAEYEIRERLLEEGRKHGGTHFICLDADETLTAPFIADADSILSNMKAGERLSLRWITLWKDQIKERIDGNFGSQFKDFIFCDNKTSHHTYAFLGVGRTPAVKDIPSTKLASAEYGVLHYQFVFWQKTQLKQAWYRCSELIKGERSARRINNTYQTSLDSPEVRLQEVQEEIFSTDLNLLPEDKPSSWHLDQIINWFSLYDITFFEPLQIWHIPELRKIFLDRVGREPVPKKFPKWLVILNSLKNYFKRIIS